MSDAVTRHNSPLDHDDVAVTAWQIASKYDSSILGRRWLGCWVDYAALIAIPVTAQLILGNALYQRSIPIWGAAMLLYFPVLEGVWGLTLGKLVSRTRVVDARGLPPGIVKATMRTLTRLIEVNPLLAGGIPAALIAYFASANQRMGDMWANTYVLKASDLPRLWKTSASLHGRP